MLNPPVRSISSCFLSVSNHSRSCQRFVCLSWWRSRQILCLHFQRSSRGILISARILQVVWAPPIWQKKKWMVHTSRVSCTVSRNNDELTGKKHNAPSKEAGSHSCTSQEQMLATPWGRRTRGILKLKMKVITARRSVASSHNSKNVFSSPPLLPQVLRYISSSTVAMPCFTKTGPWSLA